LRRDIGERHSGHALGRGTADIENRRGAEDSDRRDWVRGPEEMRRRKALRSTEDWNSEEALETLRTEKAPRTMMRERGTR
jgi:hypothetical protein